MKQTKEQGITLIALIITVIILVILAAVSINAVMNTDVIGAAQNGAMQYTQSAINENKILEDTASIMEDTIERVQKVIEGNTIKTDVDYGLGEYYADINRDGVIDGIIYADLAFDINETWGGYTAEYTTEYEKSDFGSYEIAVIEGKKVIYKTSTGVNDRFYIMETNDTDTFVGLTAEEWSGADTFGSGKANTQNLYNNLYSDIVKEAIGSDYIKFIPSRGEWTVYVARIGADNLTPGANYWTSSFAEFSDDSWRAWFFCYDYRPYFQAGISDDVGDYRLSRTF